MAKDQAAEQVQGKNPQPRYPVRRRRQPSFWPNERAKRGTPRGTSAHAAHPVAGPPRLSPEHVFDCSAVEDGGGCLPNPGLEPRRPRRRASGGTISRRAKSKTIGKLTIIAWISTTSTTAPARSAGHCTMPTSTGPDKNCPILSTCMTAAAKLPEQHRPFGIKYKLLSILLPNSRGCYPGRRRPPHHSRGLPRSPPQFPTQTRGVVPPWRLQFTFGQFPACAHTRITIWDLMLKLTNQLPPLCPAWRRCTSDFATAHAVLRGCQIPSPGLHAAAALQAAPPDRSAGPLFCWLGPALPKRLTAAWMP